ncbi:MAG: DUF3426 domain-containing protein [Syntrophales bacterium]|nr:DUF3426 domain-containing protein [Syntrophales bacterium]
MIIQCRKCDTRFRFDDTLIEGDGVWVRCSRCQHVFFQERSAAGESLAPAPADEPQIPSVRIRDARRAPEDGFSLTEERQPPAASEKEAIPPFLTSGVNKEVSPEIDKDPAIAGIEAGMEKDSLRDQVHAGWEEVPAEEEFPEDEPAHGWWGWLVLKIAALVLFIVLIAGGLSLWYFPELRTMTLEWASPWLRNVPAIEKFLGTETKSPENVQTPVGLKEIRQRSVANLLAGNLRVIEGIAVNQSPTPQARIRVRLVISDAFDAVLGEKIAYCGNLLTDAELSTLAEAEIQRELSTPQGSDVSNERIAPNGEIPFMIVFSQEQAGAIKTVVTPAGADRVP